LEHDTDGESGAGLWLRLGGCEVEMLERRCIHERLRDGACEARSNSAMS
jgi:hypothetical protein